MNRRNPPAPSLWPFRILLVSDDPETGRIWNYALLQRGWQSSLVGTAQEAVARWADDVFEMIVVDVCSRGLDGLGLCRRLRTEAVVPILLLTSSGDEAHMLAAYAAGVSECIVKPVSPALLLSKVQAWLRCSGTVTTAALLTLSVGNFDLDPTRREVNTPWARAIRLTNLEFRLLHLLMSHPGEVLGSDVIIACVWGHASESDSVLLKNLVYRLRRKLESESGQPQCVQTISGVGYTFQPS
jgi:DNA-binding response OmpR family regulator